jgi:uncharacterized protein YqeY
MINLTENKPTKQILILKETIRLVRIKTTFWDEEDFLLITELTDEEIQDIITPIVQAERDNIEEFYDNETLYLALKENYPRNLIMQYTIDNIHTLTI